MVNIHLQRHRLIKRNQLLRQNKHHTQNNHPHSKYICLRFLLLIRSIKHGRKEERGTRQKLPPPYTTHIGEKSLGDQIPKDRDAPLDPIPPNGQVSEERKYPKPSDEQENTEKENIIGDKSKK